SHEEENAVALNNLALLLALGGGGAEALPLINRALDVAGPAPELLDTRAVVYLSMGRHDRAIEDLEEAVAESPLAPAYYHLAQAYHRAGKADEAGDRFRKAIAAGLRPEVLHPLERPLFDPWRGKLGPR